MINNNSRGPTSAQHCALMKLLDPMKQRQLHNRYGIYGPSLMKPSAVRTLPTARRQATNRLVFHSTNAMNRAKPVCNRIKESYRITNQRQKNYNSQEKRKLLLLQKKARENTNSGIFPSSLVQEIMKKGNIRYPIYTPSSMKQPNKSFFGESHAICSKRKYFPKQKPKNNRKNKGKKCKN